MAIFSTLADLEKNGKAAALCSIIEAQGSTPRGVGCKMVVFSDGHTEGTVGGGKMEALVILAGVEAIKTGMPEIVNYSMVDPEKGDPGVCGGTLKVFVDPILPNPNLIVFGAGHVGKAVVKLGKILGFRVVVSDDRTELCNEEYCPGADVYASASLENALDEIEINASSYIIMTTRNVDVDMMLLPSLLEKETAYIGVIGSARRWATTKKQLIEKGITEEDIVKIKSPIGLDIGAESPEEIAVSILAEVIKIKGKG